MQIPLVITSFNQLFYLRQLVNWWRYMRPGDPVLIVDNASDYEPLVEWLGAQHPMVEVHRQAENTCVPNLTRFLQEHVRSKYPYYVISDPDIMPHPNVPPEFLEVMLAAITDLGFHHVGFNLISDDLPDYLEQGFKDEVERNEAFVVTREEVDVPYDGKVYKGRKAEIDTTFALYSSKGSGWQAPMPGEDWSKAMRIFKAFHLQWHVHPTRLPAEMNNYYSTCRGPLHKEGASAGRNHYRPSQFNDRINKLWQEHFDSLPESER